MEDLHGSPIEETLRILAERAQRLGAENSALRAENERLGAENERLQKRVDELERRVQSSTRTRFGRGKCKENPKRPGRKVGHLPAQRSKPDVIDKVVDVPLAGCLFCGGPLVAEESRDLYQTDIPPVKVATTHYRCASGWCPNCKKATTARAPEQITTPNGAIETALGPNVIALMAVLKDRLGVSFGNIAKLLEQFFGLRVSRGGISQALDRLAERLAGEYRCLVHEIRRSSVVHADETGWAICGNTAWLWVFTTETCTVFTIRRSRGRDVPLDVLGDEFDGRLVSDLLAAYTKLPYKTAKCAGHLIKELAELTRSKEGPAGVFFRGLLGAFQVALILAKVNPGQPNRTYSTIVARLKRHVKHLVRNGALIDDDDCRRIAKRLSQYTNEYLVCLTDANVPPTNNQAERKLRPAVLARRIWIGNFSKSGADRHATLASLIETCAAKATDFVALVVQAMLRLPPARAPTSA